MAMGYRMTSKHAINLTALGHCAAILTIAIWGTTFISTKVLLTCMSPITILVCRFVLGFIALTYTMASNVGVIAAVAPFLLHSWHA